MLEREDGTAHLLRHKQRLTCADYVVLCNAAADGMDIAFLPDQAYAADFALEGFSACSVTG